MFEMHEESMEQKIGKVLSAGTKFQHEYDYGSTIELKLRVVAVYKGQPPPRASRSWPVIRRRRGNAQHLACLPCSYKQRDGG